MSRSIFTNDIEEIDRLRAVNAELEAQAKQERANGDKMLARLAEVSAINAELLAALARIERFASAVSPKKPTKEEYSIWKEARAAIAKAKRS
jgi:hypothetical protein